MSDEEKRRSYLCTLQREADRLTHLVENVLAYAQLERGRHPAALGVISVDELLSPAVTERLAERAEQTGLHLTVDAGSQTHRDEYLPMERPSSKSCSTLSTTHVNTRPAMAMRCDWMPSRRALFY